MQALGRAIRKSPNKKIGTIVLPVLVPKGEKADDILDRSGWDGVWRVIKALRAQDDVLADELDGIRREMGRRTSSARRPSKIKLYLPDQIAPSFVDAFNVRLIETTTASWQYAYGLLEAIGEQDGTVATLRIRDVVRGFKLGKWVQHQRHLYKTGNLFPDRIGLLEALAGWEWMPKDQAWWNAYLAVRDYARRERNLVMPRGYRENGKPLANWVRGQREKYRQGRLPAERIHLLESIPGWTWDPRDDLWERGYRALAKYHERHGDITMPDGYEFDGVNLSQWKGTCIARWDKLSEERRRKLAKLGLTPRRKWISKAEIVKAFRSWAASHGAPPRTSDPPNTDLLPSASTVFTLFGSWNTALRAAGLKPHHRQDFWTKDKLAKALRDWAAEHGRQPKASDLRSAKDGYPLASTVARHFGSYRAGLEAAGFTLLTTPPGHWTPERIVAAIKAWNDAHGSPPVQREWGSTDGSHPTAKTAHDVFGSWTKALEAAGFRRPSSRERVFTYLRDHPHCRKAEIARGIGLSASAVGRVITKAVSEGTVSSDSDSRFARYSLI